MLSDEIQLMNTEGLSLDAITWNKFLAKSHQTMYVTITVLPKVQNVKLNFELIISFMNSYITPLHKPLGYMLCSQTNKEFSNLNNEEAFCLEMLELNSQLVNEQSRKRFKRETSIYGSK